ARPLRSFRLVDQVGLIGSVPGRRCAGRGRSDVAWELDRHDPVLTRPQVVDPEPDVAVAGSAGDEVVAGAVVVPVPVLAVLVRSLAMVVPAAPQVVAVAAAIVCRHEEGRRV